MIENEESGPAETAPEWVPESEYSESEGGGEAPAKTEEMAAKEDVDDSNSPEWVPESEYSEENEEEKKGGEAEDSKDKSTEEDPNSSEKSNGPEEESEPKESSLNVSNLPEETATVINEHLASVSDGLIENFDELNDLLEDLPAVQETIAENQRLREQIEEGVKPVYENEYAKELDEYMRNGGDPEFFHRMQGVDVDKLDPVDQVRLLKKWDYPNMSDSQIDAVINKQYKLNVEPDEDNAEDLEAAKAQLVMDATEASKQLKQHQKSYEAPKREEVTDEQIAQQNQERLNSWGDFANEYADNLEDIVEVDLGNDSELKIELNSSDREFIAEKTQELIEHSGLENNEESQEKVSEAVYGSWLIHNHDRIVQEAYKRGLSDQEKRDLDKRQNPSSIDDKGEPTNNSDTKDKDDFILDVYRREMN